MFAADGSSRHGAEHANRKEEGKRHGDANDSFECEEHRCERRDDDRERSQPRCPARVVLLGAVVEPAGRRAHRERRAEEDRGVVPVEQQCVQPERSDADRDARSDPLERRVQPALHDYVGGRTLSVRPRGSDGEDKHQDPVDDRDEEEEHRPRRQPRVARAAERHRYADPEEGQRPDRHRDEHPFLLRTEGSPSAGDQWIHVVERRPLSTGGQAHHQRIAGELERGEQCAVDEIRAPVDALGQPEPEREESPHAGTLLRAAKPRNRGHDAP